MANLVSNLRAFLWDQTNCVHINSEIVGKQNANTISVKSEIEKRIHRRKKNCQYFYMARRAIYNEPSVKLLSIFEKQIHLIHVKTKNKLDNFKH